MAQAVDEVDEVAVATFELPPTDMGSECRSLMGDPGEDKVPPLLRRLSCVSMAGMSAPASILRASEVMTESLLLILDGSHSNS